jgi:hypothetical protein
VEKAWNKAEEMMNAYFGQNQGKPVLDALYEVANQAVVHARAELKINTNERWWWRDSTTPAAARGRPKSASDDDDDIDDDDDDSNDGMTNDMDKDDDLECHEPYDEIEVQKDADPKKQHADIIRVAQETLILRYAATVLRQKARDLAVRRMKQDI